MTQLDELGLREVLERSQEQNLELHNQLVAEKKARQLAEDRLCSLLYSKHLEGHTCRDVQQMAKEYTNIRETVGGWMRQLVAAQEALLAAGIPEGGTVAERIQRLASLPTMDAEQQETLCSPATPIVPADVIPMVRDLVEKFYTQPENRRRAEVLIYEALAAGFKAADRLQGEHNQAVHLLRQVFYARNALGTKFCDELEQWKLEDLEQEIVELLEGKKHADTTRSV